MNKISNLYKIKSMKFINLWKIMNKNKNQDKIVKKIKVSLLIEKNNKKLNKK